MRYSIVLSLHHVVIVNLTINMGPMLEKIVRPVVKFAKV